MARLGQISENRVFTTRHRTPKTWLVGGGSRSVVIMKLWAIPPVVGGIYNIPADDGRYGQLNVIDNDRNDCVGSYDVRSLMDIYWRYALQAGDVDFEEKLHDAAKRLEQLKNAGDDQTTRAIVELLQSWVRQYRTLIPVFEPVQFNAGSWFAISHSDEGGHELPPVEFQITLVKQRIVS